MKTPLRFLIASTMLLTLSTAVFAEGFQMDRVTAGARYVEDNDPEVYEWIYFNSNANYDWMKMNLQGKFYAQEMKENWIDYSPGGMGDLYNGVAATFRFPSLSKGFEASLGYKQNYNFDVALWGVGYGWGFGKDLSMGVRYDEAYRNERNSAGEGTYTEENGNFAESFYGDLKRKQQQFYLTYSPQNWKYSLDFKRIERDFDNPNHDSLAYVLDHKLTWQATSKLEVGLRNVVSSTDYEMYSDDDYTKWELSGKYKRNDNWSYNGTYTTSAYEGHDGIADRDSLYLRGKYDSNSNWWYAVKLYLYDYYFDQKYKDHNNPRDLDADYNSRTAQVVAFEYEEKMEKFNYNLEAFVKNYAYETESATVENWQDRVDCGLIGTLTWDWASLHWKLRVAPWGDLDTRKANAELTATYKF